MSGAVEGAEGLPRYRPYFSYKASGVDWLGDIPAHWTVLSLKFALSMPITDGPHETPEFLDAGIPFLSAEAVKNDRLDFTRKRGHISEKDHARFSRKYKPRLGDVYMVKSGATTGNVARVEATQEFNIWSPLAAMRPHPRRLLTDFLFYAIKSKPFTKQVELGWSYGTQQNIGMGVVANLPVFLPQLDEQRAIAEFLDRETGKIDALVAKKERLIDLLQEKRTALITHAVTKGLDPTAPIKPSGVDWLGDIPAHWQVKRLKNVITAGVQNGLFKKKDAFGSGTPLVNVFDIYRERFFVDGESLERVEANSNERSKYAVAPGDIFFVRSSLKLEGVGRSACFAQLSEQAVFECHLVRIGPDTTLARPDFLIYFLNSRAAIQRLISLANTVTMTTLPQSGIARLEIAIPPLAEQEAIMEQLAWELDRFDKLERRIRDAVTSLAEFRTALISAAVTGKIDVRDEVA